MGVIQYVTVSAGSGHVCANFNVRPRVLKHNLGSIDLESSEGQAQFIHLTGVTAEDFQQYGQDVKSRGGTRRYIEVLWQPDAALNIHIFRRRRPDWNQLAACVPQGKHDEALRYTEAPTWDQNSCAIDTILVLANQMQVGRINSDIISLQRHMDLIPTERTFRQVLAGAWGILPQQDRDKLRNILSEALRRFDPAKYAIGRFHTIQSQFDHWMGGVGQVSWMEAPVSSCCDGVKTVGSQDSVRRTNSVVIISPAGKKHTLAHAVNASFAIQVVNPVSTRCSNGLNCRQRVDIRRHTVLDHDLPPRLMIHFDVSVSHAEAAIVQPFDEFELQYWTLSGPKRCKFQPRAAIFVENSIHFTCRWKLIRPHAHPAFRHFDGGFSMVNSWWQRYDNDSARVVSVLFETLDNPR